MGTINQQTLAERLSKLNSTQQSIETLSQWCIFYRKEARKIVAAWEADFSRAPMPRKLALCYLANDILQNSRKKGPEFVEQFYRALPKPLKHLRKHGDGKVRKAVDRLVNIWEERRVFGASGAKSLKELLQEANTPVKASPAAPPPQAPSAAPASGVDQKRLAALMPLATALSDVQQAASNCVRLVDQCAQTLHQGLAESTDAGELRGAVGLLQEYANALTLESQRRERAVAILQGLLAPQEDSKRRAAEQLRICKTQLEHPGSVPPWQQSSGDYSQGLNGSGELHHQGSGLQPQHSGFGSQDGDAASLAAQLAGSGQSAQALLEALAMLPQDQQAEIGFNMVSVLSQSGQQYTDAGNPPPPEDEEYDPSAF
ncbi:hypothetical protein WJX72_004649 [[Myrmecia] bisecta]|uniref:CID domain-containing protein n=1 Tax=[Myrmecia] bisecta TaxID=41462 RepID=A0AAW1P886_9CHLO